MPQPIDLQTELARANVAERIQDTSSRLSLAAQQRAQEDAESERVLADTSVKESPENQSESLDEDGRRKAPFVARRRKRQGEGEKAQGAKPRPKNSGEGEHFDVTV